MVTGEYLDSDSKYNENLPKSIKSNLFDLAREMDVAQQEITSVLCKVLEVLGGVHGDLAKVGDRHKIPLFWGRSLNDEKSSNPQFSKHVSSSNPKKKFWIQTAIKRQQKKQRLLDQNLLVCWMWFAITAAIVQMVNHPTLNL